MRAHFPAVLLALLLAGCLGAPPAPEAPAPDARSDEASLRAIEEAFSGTALATPATPSSEPFTLVVPQGAVGVNATLAWSDPVARFTLALVDPDGEVAARGYAERSGRLVAATVDPPRSGTWTFLVNATVAANVDFELLAVAELLVPDDNLVRQTTQLRAPGFNEVNLIMEKDATFTFSFNASQPIHWDIHSHPGSEVKYWQQGTDASKAGSFTAPERGIYSILFSNEGALPAELSFEVRGKFRLHSHAQ